MSPMLFDDPSLIASAVTDAGADGPLAQIASVARVQYGVVSRTQITMLGLRDSWIHRQLEAGRLHRVSDSVYAVGHLGLSRRGWAAAALLRAGTGSALSHTTAARLWEIVPSATRGPVHVSLASRRGLPPGPGVVIHRPRTLVASDIVNYNGFPVTTPERTLRDQLRTHSGAQITRMLEQMVTKVGRSPDELHAWAADLPPVVGRAKLLSSLEHVMSPTLLRSELEVAFRSLCENADLPLPETNVNVGLWEVDAIWRRLGVAVELDSYRWHGGKWAFYRDRDKGLALSRAGLELLRVTWPQIKHREAEVVETLKVVLHRAERRARAV